jgi:hypothetical protein
MTIFWRQGVVSGHCNRFWRQLWDIRRKNPSRIRRYFVSVATGENLFAFCREVLKRAKANLKEL